MKKTTKILITSIVIIFIISIAMMKLNTTQIVEDNETSEILKEKCPDTYKCEWLPNGKLYRLYPPPLDILVDYCGGIENITYDCPKPMYEDELHACNPICTNSEI